MVLSLLALIDLRYLWGKLLPLCLGRRGPSLLDPVEICSEYDFLAPGTRLRNLLVSFPFLHQNCQV